MPQTVVSHEAHAHAHPFASQFLKYPQFRPKPPKQGKRVINSAGIRARVRVRNTEASGQQGVRP